MTRAFGGVENGDAKHIDAATVTANRNGTGLPLQILMGVVMVFVLPLLFAF